MIENEVSTFSRTRDAPVRLSPVKARPLIPVPVHIRSACSPHQHKHHTHTCMHTCHAKSNQKPRFGDTFFLCMLCTIIVSVYCCPPTTVHPNKTPRTWRTWRTPLLHYKPWVCVPDIWSFRGWLAFSPLSG